MSEIPLLPVYDSADPRCLDIVTSAGHDYLAGKFLLRAPRDLTPVPLVDLLETERFETIVDLFQSRFPGVDRRALVSFWSLFYLSTVGIGVTVAAVVYGVRLPLALDSLALLQAPDGQPQALLLPHGGTRSEEPVGVEMLQALLRDHCAPLVEAIAHGQKVSKRMLWTNLIVYLDWVLRDIGALLDDDAVSDCLAALASPGFADSAKNPLFGLLRHDPATGEPLRKVCCLRYSIPGVGGCGGVCPLPEGREAVQAVAAE
jgi:ferric iron reductase protein FhuF